MNKGCNLLSFKSGYGVPIVASWQFETFDSFV